jgi:hypothetical protein
MQIRLFHFFNLNFIYGHVCSGVNITRHKTTNKSSLLYRPAASVKASSAFQSRLYSLGNDAHPCVVPLLKKQVWIAASGQSCVTVLLLGQLEIGGITLFLDIRVFASDERILDGCLLLKRPR